MHKDPVTPELRAAVIDRDWRESWRRSGMSVPLDRFPRARACVASFLDPSPCQGRLTLDHIKTEPRMGLRAPSLAANLVTLCEGHTENGMRGGRVWNTAHRPLLRDYLREVI